MINHVLQTFLLGFLKQRLSIIRASKFATIIVLQSTLSVSALFCEQKTKKEGKGINLCFPKKYSYPTAHITMLNFLLSI